MSKIKNGRLDQYGAEPFKHQQFGTAGVERVNWLQYDGLKLRSHKISKYRVAVNALFETK